MRLLAVVALLLPLSVFADRAIPDQKTQFCYSYVKGLKALWYDIHQKGIEQVMIEHPPADEGMDDEQALVLAHEIEAVESGQAQAWIERKWDGCMADPYSVRR